MSTESATSSIRVLVVTPEETVFDLQADFVSVPLFDGELGVARDHSPMIGRLGFGEMRIRAGDTTTSLYVEGGFVQVAGNEVSVLTSRALPAGEVDAAAAEEQLSTLLRTPAAGDGQIAARGARIDQARGQIRVARKA
jgi:F-type H+-transporting ATPase subunit epsilon